MTTARPTPLATSLVERGHRLGLGREVREVVRADDVVAHAACPHVGPARLRQGVQREEPDNRSVVHRRVGAVARRSGNPVGDLGERPVSSDGDRRAGHQRPDGDISEARRVSAR